MRFFAGLAILFALSSPAAAAALSCACAPCPRVLPGPCTDEPPCCGDPAEKDTCDCAHLDVQDALPMTPDAFIPPGTAPLESESFASSPEFPDTSAVPDSGPDPPALRLHPFLRIVVLRP
jgi:hypothetical protein